MQCNGCNKDFMIMLDDSVDGLAYCKDCFEKFHSCEVCGKLTKHRQLLNNTFACDSCFSAINKSIDDPRTKMLLAVKLSELKQESPKTQDDFESLGNEALASAIKLKHYEIIGVSPIAPLNEIKAKCKEFMQTWHPDLHKQDPDKYKQAVDKVSEIKKAYEAIVAEKEEPYLPLELKYGASQKEILLAYEKLKEIYNPAYFADDLSLQEKVKFKRDEVTKAYEYLMMIIHQGDKIESPCKPTKSAEKPQIATPVSKQNNDQYTEAPKQTILQPSAQPKTPKIIQQEAKIITGKPFSKKILSVIGTGVLLFIGLFGLGVSREVGRSAANKIMSPSIEELLTKAKDSVNSKAPMMVDSDTQLDSASTRPGNMFSYNYTFINHASTEYDPSAFMSEFKPIVKQKVCNANELSMFFKKGITISYNYRGNDANDIGRFVFSPSDCGYPK